jgi:hypothetical protein
LTLGVFVTAVAAVGCLAAIIHFLNTRPLLMEQETVAAAAALKQALVSSRVPQGGVTTKVPERRFEGNTYYTFHDVGAVLPTGVDVPGLVEVLRRAADPHGADLRDETRDDESVTLTFALRGHAFARLQMVLPPEPKATPRADRRGASRDAARSIARTLPTYGLLDNTAASEQEREASDAVWNHSHYLLELSAGRSPQDVAEAVRMALVPDIVEVDVEPDVTGERVTLRIYENGREWADVVCVLPLPELDPVITAKDESALALDGLEDSLLEPTEESATMAQADTSSPLPVESSPEPDVLIEPPSDPVVDTSEPDTPAEDVVDESVQVAKHDADVTAIPVPVAPKTDEERVAGITASLALALPSQDQLPLEKGRTPLPREGVVDGPKRMAIVLGDGGYGGPVSDAVLELDPRLTLAVLPYAPFSQETSAAAKAGGHEVLLHMPMQATDGVRRYPGELGMDMDAVMIAALVQKALQDVPDAIGVSNHAGDVFTTNAPAMEAFLTYSNDQKLFYLDNVTHPRSVGVQVAAGLTVPHGARDVVLDAVPQTDAVREQYEALLQVCEQHGTAIGVGHFSAATVVVLRELLPKLEERGINLVPLSELVK